MRAVGAGLVDVGAGGDERLAHLDVAVAAANINGVKPLVVDRRTSAPPSMSIRAISV